MTWYILRLASFTTAISELLTDTSVKCLASIVTPHGRVAFYDAAKGEIVKPDGWRPPDFRSLIKVAQTEQGKSEASCVSEDVKGVIKAKPMIFTEDTEPLTLPLLTKLGCKTDESVSVDNPVPDELGRTIESLVACKLGNVIWQQANHVYYISVAKRTASQWANHHDMESTCT